MFDLTVGDFGELFDGPHATPTRIDNGPYFLNISSLKEGRLDLEESDHVSETDFAKWTKRVEPAEGDLLFSYETRLGEAALMPAGIRACLGRRMALIRPDGTVVDPKFLLYFFLSPDFQRTIEQHTIHGATVNRISLSTMSAWPVRIPNLAEQRAIAEVLGALDDKIAANTRLSKTSAKVAQALFESTLESAEVQWKPLGSVATIVLGGTPSKDNPSFWTDGTVAWLNSGKANEDRIIRPSEYITDEALSRSAAKLMPVGATLIAITGATLGQIARLEIEASGNQSLVGIWAADPGLNDWLYFGISSQIPELLTRATGAAQQHVNKRDVESLNVPVADAAGLASFYEAVGPILRVAVGADRENVKLAETRDALLPRLMSGKLRVKDAEKVLETAGV